MDYHAEVARAHERIRTYVRATPLEQSHPLGSLQGPRAARVFLKLESEQITGSFKARGAYNRLLTLSDAQRAQGIVTASTGNHALACAHAMKRLGISGSIYVPENVSPAKKEALSWYDAPLTLFGTDCLDTELEARRVADAKGVYYVSPYNDPQVMAGQGTIAVEILEALPEVDAIFVPVGGGGLIGGIAAYAKRAKPSVQIVGCLPKNSPVMLECIKAGRVIDMPTLDTLSDGTAGGIEEGSCTFEVCRDFVDEWVVVEEGEIAAAMRLVADKHHRLIEGSAGVGVASYIRKCADYVGKTVVVVVCGSNISLEKVRTVILGEPKGAQ